MIDKPSVLPDSVSVGNPTQTVEGGAPDDVSEQPRRRNWTPAVIAFSPALLLPLTQYVVRPHVHHPSLLVLVLASAPNLIIGLCFPFSILVRPSAWTHKVADALFGLWSLFTLSVLIAVEYLSPFGGNVFDPRDVLASFAGVALAIVLYLLVVRARLTFAAPTGIDGAGMARS